MSWIEIIVCATIVAALIGLYWYAIRHRHDPFWRAFLDPYCIDPIRPRRHRSDLEALRSDWQAVAKDMREVVADLLTPPR